MRILEVLRGRWTNGRIEVGAATRGLGVDFMVFRQRVIGELENESLKELDDLVLEGRERVLLCDAGRMVEVGSDLHEVLIERGLHPGHLRLEVRDLLLLRVQGARGKPKGPADLGVGLREILELLCESRDFDVDGFGAEGHVQASTGRGNMPLAGALAVEP